jgi:hypothetical protein
VVARVRVLTTIPTQMVGLGEDAGALVLAYTSVLTHSVSTSATMVLRPRLSARVTRW